MWFPGQRNCRYAQWHTWACLLICKKNTIWNIWIIFSEKGIIFCHTSGKWIPDDLINQSFTMWRILSWNNILGCLTWLPILIIQFSLFQVRKLKSYERIFLENLQLYLKYPKMNYLSLSELLCQKFQISKVFSNTIVIQNKANSVD